MKVLVLDESVKRTDQIVEILQKKRYNFISCAQSSTFMDALRDETVDKILLDYDAWKHGKMIYNFFGVPKKIENIPVVFYNAPENFVALGNRKRHDNDRIIYKSMENDAFIKMLMEL